MTLAREGVGILLRTVVAVTLLTSATAKVTGSGLVRGALYSGPDLFAAIIREHGLIPDAYVRVCAWAVILVEVGVGIALLASPRSVKPVAAAAVMVACFTGYMVYVNYQFGPHPCGCLGDALPTQLPVLLVRNGLVLIACVGAALALYGKSEKTKGVAASS